MKYWIITCNSLVDCRLVICDKLKGLTRISSLWEFFMSILLIVFKSGFKHLSHENLRENDTLFQETNSTDKIFISVIILKSNVTKFRWDFTKYEIDRHNKNQIELFANKFTCISFFFYCNMIFKSVLENWSSMTNDSDEFSWMENCNNV